MSQLFFFTNSFPYGRSETFIENEIHIVSKNFDKIHIFPRWVEEGKRDIPTNCVVHNIEFGNTNCVKNLILDNIFTIVKIVFLDLFSKENRKALKRTKAYFNDLIRLLYESKILDNYIKAIAPKNRVFYTYWFYDWTLNLSVLKRKGDKLISRSHGYDFDFYQNGDGYYPFRPFLWTKITMNFNVSKFGFNYLGKRYPKWKSKIGVSYLGVQEQKQISKSGLKKTWVSCSNVIPIKRVEIIPQILKEIEEEVHWVHFGDGNEMTKVKEACKGLPKNITFDLRGSVANSEVLNYYKENDIDLFVHLSETEGLPVSMMEVQSFGIPILACDVGGVKEIVSNKTGYLMPKDFTTKDALKGLNTISGFSEGHRDEIAQLQRSKFSAKNNYGEFCKLIKKI